MQLAPTLWRTCRVLANDVRLRCLVTVLDQPAVPVGDIAKVVGISACLASLYLRQIQARGLIRAQRLGSLVRYAALADPAVKHAAPLLATLQQVALRRAPGRADAIRILTGFTHPRRLIILSVIDRRGPQTADDLAHATGISHQALARHLHKLMVRGLLARMPSGWTATVPGHPLAATLLRETCGQTPVLATLHPTH